MALSAGPAAELANLPKADGSATYSYQGYTVTSAVNGPIEASRREESAYEAQVDVIVRPSAGVGGKNALDRPLLSRTSYGRIFSNGTVQARLSDSSRRSSRLL
jgi:ribonuclease PH